MFCYFITPILWVKFRKEIMGKMQNKIWFIIPKYFVENSGTKKWLKKGREQGQNEGLRWPKALLPIMGHPAYCKKWAQANKKYAVTCIKSKWQHLFFWKPLVAQNQKMSFFNSWVTCLMCLLALGCVIFAEIYLHFRRGKIQKAKDSNSWYSWWLVFWISRDPVKVLSQKSLIENHATWCK